ncbi:hypothetical protein Y1Q_0002685 [Alligator mississippiensis]|uniref:Uncharacterized protein n=1 Tax=Alligator mississippiensis TaxID=8496 RepID=A0A151NZ28_ALLMI|nr:hypothetical protein Y1Q_0002685 [Alligator mississippiensis]
MWECRDIRESVIKLQKKNLAVRQQRARFAKHKDYQSTFKKSQISCLTLLCSSLFHPFVEAQEGIHRTLTHATTQVTQRNGWERLCVLTRFYWASPKVGLHIEHGHEWFLRIRNLTMLEPTAVPGTC